jgi:hypothetical protein
MAVKEIKIEETGFTEAVLEDKQRGYFFEKSDSNVLLVTFGGIQQGIAMPMFEFFNSLQQYQVNKLFIRDFSQSWYHQGSNSIGIDIFSIKAFIEEVKRQHGITKLVIIGNSAGGYAALLFGALLSADSVHAFAPQTFLNKWNRFKYWDTRWGKQIKRLHRDTRSKELLDLKSYLSSYSIVGDFNIYYCSNNRLDKIHATRLENFSAIKLHAYLEGGHAVIKHLKETGALSRILTKSIL